MVETFQWSRRVNQNKVDEIYLKHFGQAYTEYRELWNKAGKKFLPEFPIHLDFEIVDACNLRCRHCFRNEEISRKLGIAINTGERLSLEVFKKVMMESAKYGLKAVNFGFSGECVLNPDLIEMIHIAGESGVLDIRLLTNGTLITPEIADRLLSSPLTLLSFSADAGCAETYEKLKGKDSFDYVQNIVRYTYRKKSDLKKDFPLIRASFYLSTESRGEQNTFLEKFQNYVDFIDFQVFRNMRKVKKHRIEIACNIPFKRLAIFANGDVSPCCAFFSKKLIVGNINQMSIKEIWNSKAVNDVRKGLTKQRPIAVCDECLHTATEW